jgi:hypothetical protein
MTSGYTPGSMPEKDQPGFDQILRALREGLNERWCLEPAQARSTGEGPSGPLEGRGCGSSPRLPATSRSCQRRSSGREDRGAVAPTPLRAATPATAAKRSPRNSRSAEGPSAKVPHSPARTRSP